MTILVGLSLVALGVGVGLMSAMFGVGGGVIMVPYIVVVLEETQHLAEGTSLLVIVPTALAGVIAHRKRGYVSFSAAAVIAAAGVFGAFAGARLALSIEADALQVYFGVFTCLVGLRLLADGLRRPNNT